MTVGKRQGQPYDACIISTIHRDFDNRIYQRQLNALVDAGMSVVMVAPWDFSKRARDDFDFVATAFPETRAQRLPHGFATYRAVRRIKARVYIFHDNDFLPYAWLLRQFGGRTVVYDAHENIPEEILYGKDWIPAPLRPGLSAAFRALENFVVRRLGEVIAAVNHLKTRFEAEGATVALVRNFPNFRAPADASHNPGVLYTGELTPDYGVWTIIEIARLFKVRGRDIPIRVVDRFHDDQALRSKFKGIVAEEHLGIEMLDSVPADRMPELLRNGTMGLIPVHNVPNKALALPTKGFEYFLFGLVTFASRVGGNTDIIEDGVTGFLVEAEDAVAWADTIERVWDDAALQGRVRAAARRVVEEQFNWETERRTLVAYVEGLVRGNR